MFFAGLLNDIALIRLLTPLVFNRYVKPICLQAIGAIGPAVNEMCTIVGWGRVKQRVAFNRELFKSSFLSIQFRQYQFSPAADHLRLADVSISHCDNNEMICAGGGDVGPCKGDSGGPLACLGGGGNRQYYLAGIISHGEGCARVGSPGKYTRVSLFLEWIQDSTTLQNAGGHIRTNMSCPGVRCDERCLPLSAECNGFVSNRLNLFYFFI